jgi:hypothetical protein
MYLVQKYEQSWKMVLSLQTIFSTHFGKQNFYWIKLKFSVGILFSYKDGIL